MPNGTQTQRGRKLYGTTQTEGDKKQFWKNYWKQKNRGQKDKEEVAHLHKNEAKNNYWKMRNGGDRTPWKPSDGYRLNDIKMISK